MNNYVYNVDPDPLYVSNINSYESFVEKGELFSATSSSFEISLGTSFYIQLSNPSDSGKTVFLKNISITTSGVSVGLIVSIYKNGSIGSPTGGFNVYNNNFGSTITNKATVSTRNTPVSPGGDLLYFTLVPVSIYSNFLASAITLTPNTRMVIKINEFAAVGDTSINISWIEQ